MLNANELRNMMDKVILFLSDWLESHLKEIYGSINWNKHIYSKLTLEQQKFATESGANSLDRLDLSSLISVFVGNFNELRRAFRLGADLKSMALTAKTLRNVDSHRSAYDIKTIDEDKLKFRIEALKHLLTGLGAGSEVTAKIDNLEGIENRREPKMYADRIRDINSIDFYKIVRAAHDVLPPELQKTPWKGLEHGVIQLSTEQQLDQYLAAYGKMHLDKIHKALDAIENPSEELTHNLSIVDWGCGQALATCGLIDWMREKELDLSPIHQVFLVEPSHAAIERAECNLKEYERQHNFEAEIHCVNKVVDQIAPEDFNVDGEATTVHLLSNILDIESINLDAFTNFIKNKFTGRQVFCCVGPLNQGSHRIMEFAAKFGVTEEQIKGKFNGNLRNRCTVSMVTFVIDDGATFIKKVEFLPFATPEQITADIPLQRVIGNCQPKDNVLDRILQFYQISTELERSKEPDAKGFFHFRYDEQAGTLNINLSNNSCVRPTTNEDTEKFLNKLRINLDDGKTKWPKDLYIGIDLLFDNKEYPIIYFVKPASEMKSQMADNDAPINISFSVNLRDFALVSRTVESLQLTDDKINAIENVLQSDDVTISKLEAEFQRDVDGGCELNRIAVSVVLCDKSIPLAQIYAELKKITAHDISSESLLKDFLENAEVKNQINNIGTDELISIVPMDDSQRNAVAHSLNNRVTLVVGPPGCGKTQMILNLMANALVRGKKVLIASKNNKAVDNIKDRFDEFDPNCCFIRFGEKRYMRDVALPHIDGLLNKAQAERFDDTEFAAAIDELHTNWQEIRTIPQLEEDLDNLDIVINSSNINLKNFEDELANLPDQRAQVRDEFIQRARTNLNEQRGQCIVEKTNAESLRLTLNSQEQTCRDNINNVEAYYREKAISKLESELESIRKVAHSLDAALLKMKESHPLISELEIDPIQCSERLRKTASDVEYRTGGFLGFIPRMFNGRRYARNVLSMIGQWPVSLRNYLMHIDGRHSIAELSKCSDIVSFCRKLADGLDEAVKYKNKSDELAERRREIGRLQFLLNDRTQVEEYVRANYATYIANRRSQLQRELENIQTQVQTNEKRIVQLNDNITSIDASVIDDDRLYDVARGEWRDLIDSRERQLEQLERETNQKIIEERATLLEAKTFRNTKKDELSRIKSKIEEIKTEDFGRQMVSMALGHYLHVNDSARYISAYRAYLPDGIPYRNEEIQRFTNATKRFLDVFHLVSVTSLSVKNALPRVGGLFDLLIIDEASQCDVASALPLILRAKQIVVVGDPMQLRHISRVEAEEELAMKSHLNISNLIHLKYAEASLWDYVRNWLPWCGNESPCVLENHYRCHPQIIGYSNEIFYNDIAIGGLRVCTTMPHGNWNLPEGIVWYDVNGTVGHGNVNEKEVDAAIKTATKIADTSNTATIGIVTPFKEQAQRLNNQIPNEYRNRIIADTVHRFQGDERDVMIYSLVASGNGSDGKIRWIDYKVPNLVNVAVTRAKRLLVVVGNKGYIQGHSRANLPLGHLVNYVNKLVISQTNNNAAPVTV